MWITPKEDSIYSASSYYVRRQQITGYRTLGIHPPTALRVKPESRLRSYIRFTNFSTIALEIDIFLDNRPIARNLNYKEQTMYFSVFPRESKVSIYLSDKPDAPIYETSITIPEAAVISTFTVNLLEGIELIDMDDNADISPDKVSVKFANVSPNSPPLSLLINEQEKFINITTNDITGYIDITRATIYNLIIKRTDTEEILFNAPNLILNTGNAYTFYAIGLLDDTPPFEIVTTLDGSSYFLD